MTDGPMPNLHELLSGDLAIARFRSTPAEHIAQYLRITDKIRGGQNEGRSYERFILDFGHVMSGGELPKGVARGQARRCFANSLEAVMADRERFAYCEGWALNSGLPHSPMLAMHHAWLWDTKDKRAVDCTWKTEDGVNSYLGIAFEYNFALEALSKSGSVLFDYARSHPLLLGNLRQEEWRHPAMIKDFPPIEGPDDAVSPRPSVLR
jgi:hypothetical protein